MCPINPSNAAVFNFGIFLDSLQSGMVGTTKFRRKFLYYFWWGLRNLRFGYMKLFIGSRILLNCVTAIPQLTTVNETFMLFGLSLSSTFLYLDSLIQRLVIVELITWSWLINVFFFRKTWLINVVFDISASLTLQFFWSKSSDQHLSMGESLRDFYFLNWHATILYICPWNFAGLCVFSYWKVLWASLKVLVILFYL